MSEDFLTRWSRRKRDVAETERAKGAPGERDTIAEDAIPENAKSVEAIEPPPEPAFDLKNLPSIESITAATDVRPFQACLWTSPVRRFDAPGQPIRVFGISSGSPTMTGTTTRLARPPVSGRSK
jgi:hypothetical protein